MSFATTPESFRHPLDRHGAPWRAWLAANVQAGVPDESMFVAMIKDNVWTRLDAQAAINAARAEFGGEALEVDPQAAIVDVGRAKVDLPYIPEVGRFRLDGRVCEVTMRFETPKAALIENVLSPEECASLIAYCRERGFIPSAVIDEVTGGSTPHPDRTSDGVMIARGETPLIASIEDRLSRLTRWPVAKGEPLQALSYVNGQQYRPHYDAFGGSNGAALNMQRGGQRLATLLVYLASPDAGGGTSFPRAGLMVRPRAGSVIMWHNVDPYGAREKLSLHAGMPVEAGEKIILTLWQRSEGFVG